MSECPRLADLSNALSNLSWPDVLTMSLRLGVEYSTLRRLEDDFPTSSVRIIHALQKWLDIDPEASWQKLVDILRKISQRTLAFEITQTYIVNRGPESYEQIQIDLEPRETLPLPSPTDPASTSHFLPEESSSSSSNILSEKSSSISLAVACIENIDVDEDRIQVVAKEVSHLETIFFLFLVMSKYFSAKK